MRVICQCGQELSFTIHNMNGEQVIFVSACTSCRIKNEETGENRYKMCYDR